MKKKRLFLAVFFSHPPSIRLCHFLLDFVTMLLFFTRNCCGDESGGGGGEGGGGGKYRYRKRERSKKALFFFPVMSPFPPSLRAQKQLQRRRKRHFLKEWKTFLPVPVPLLASSPADRPELMGDRERGERREKRERGEMQWREREKQRRKGRSVAFSQPGGKRKERERKDGRRKEGRRKSRLLALVDVSIFTPDQERNKEKKAFFYLGSGFLERSPRKRGMTRILFCCKTLAKEFAEDPD